MQKITPFLWFSDKAEEAMNFYVSIFKNSKVGKVTRYGDSGPGPKGSVMTATFQLEGQEFMALNGGPHFKFSPAISFFVNCETQEELDELWASAGGKTNRCGWLDDKFGVSWQIIPTILGKLLQDKIPRNRTVTEAMLKMDKIDISTKARYEHEPGLILGRTAWQRTKTIDQYRSFERDKRAASKLRTNPSSRAEAEECIVTGRCLPS